MRSAAGQIGYRVALGIEGYRVDVRPVAVLPVAHRRDQPPRPLPAFDLV